MLLQMEVLLLLIEELYMLSQQPIIILLLEEQELLKTQMVLELEPLMKQSLDYRQIHNILIEHMQPILQEPHMVLYKHSLHINLGLVLLLL